MCIRDSSQATIFGGGLVNFFMNFPLRHPKVPDRPLIQYDVVLMLEPMMLAGTVVGAYLNAVFPSWLIVVMLLLFLTYSTWRTSQKARSIWRKEREAADAGETDELLEMAPQDHSFSGDLTSPRSFERLEERTRGLKSDLAHMTDEVGRLGQENADLKDKFNKLDSRISELEAAGSNSNLNELGSLEGFGFGAGTGYEEVGLDVPSANDDSSLEEGDCSPGRDAMIAEVEAQERDAVGPLAWATLILVLISVLSLLRGGKAGMTSIVGVEACSGSYWAITLISMATMIGSTVFFGNRVAAQNDLRVQIGYPPIEGDIVWNSRNVIMYPVLAMAAGAMGGMLGIGGGMIMGPLLLELGMLAETTAATSATTVLLTAASGTFQETLLGMMLYQRGVWYFSLGAISTLIGQVGVNHIVRRYKMSALIVVMVVVVMALSMVMMTWVGLVQIQEDLKRGNDMGFASFCS
eukprot:TRINITY_DN21329_c0_g1_i3.p1 TRINITY_DN21329_c0_g1~~TRINITY_DN21329_c0_g1_i3.p1  ORF type:complete len:464 (-),score=127.55 TRINITY_DN21329_c0_g1_i3:180-1571(-)